MNSPGLTCLDLDIIAAGGCQMENCNHEHEDTLFMKAGCHPEEAVRASYTVGTGLMQLECSLCKAFIANIKVADR